MILTIRQICNAINGSYKGKRSLFDKTVSIALTDSRSLTDASQTVFFAIRTSAGDGHNYIDSLYAKGVRAFVVDYNYKAELPDDAAVLSCENSLRALQNVGAYIRRNFDIPVIGITGSIGKTILKEQLNRVLMPTVNVARSPRSWNSQVGLPLSLWQLSDNSQVGIYEAGVSMSGEMQKLAAILSPTIGVLTPITSEHDRGFSSRRQKIEEKSALFATCSDIIVFQDDVAQQVIEKMYPDRMIHVVTTYTEACEVIVDLLGQNVDLQSIDMSQTSTRIDITETPVGLTVAFDHFTCDNLSLETALDVIRRRIPAGASLAAILGDLQCRETEAEEAYSKLFSILKRYGVTRLITAGSEIEHYASALSIPIRVTAFSSPGQLMSSMDVYDFYNFMVYVNGKDNAALLDVYNWLSRHRNVTRMEINLDALGRNYSYFRSLLSPKTGVIGMVKAGAYGCGALEVARTLESKGADMMAVAVVDEGVELRQGGVTLPIIVLDPWCDNLGAIFAYNLQPTLIDASENTLAMLEQAADAQGVDIINVHIKLDTGMHRVGLCENEIDDFARLLRQHPRFHVKTIFSHLAAADCPELDEYTKEQLAQFERMSSKLISQLGYETGRHILNTAGIERYAHIAGYDFARLGIGLYGISPLESVNELLLPVSRLVTRVIATRVCQPGDTIGYGCHDTVKRVSVIGTLPVGYADGIDRRMGNGNARFWVDGKLCPTIGNICMDLCMIDLTDCEAAHMISTSPLEVEIFGPMAPIENLAKAIGTISYEILARISPRVKRVYFRE